MVKRPAPRQWFPYCCKLFSVPDKQQIKPKQLLCMEPRLKRRHRFLGVRKPVFFAGDVGCMFTKKRKHIYFLTHVEPPSVLFVGEQQIITGGRFGTNRPNSGMCCNNQKL
ncbi:hypothetical protein EC465_24375 [Salmonella enterica subsp. enterica serovar Muenchen]|nr:hypothetical protein [Salmonella enterica subsp. enterica serovar Bahati]EBZ5940614.1 hypothetical protein [Salmonella enterica subsp. enterica serovar Muenchen]